MCARNRWPPTTKSYAHEAEKHPRRSGTTTVTLSRSGGHATSGADEPYHHLLDLLAREERGHHTFVIDLLPIRDPETELEVLRRRMDRGMLGQSELTQRLDAAIERLGGSTTPRGTS